jgi:hypothetical protein
LELADAVERHVVGMNFAIDVRFPHPAGDQLRVLAAKVENENHSQQESVQRSAFSLKEFFLFLLIADG